ncbi:Wzz/FepE/Etk N-terminal domain-containing protein [Mitsuaria sp. GD03876]|uniref:Wzz/FepE/Etk N-terminal domain-containing protein n=1 Tax=Mitsuaria sp. GD03876 TaxID=2975399 RepID=UPI002448E433|nr:Wzz/FepE/Etk N-terminal domain-containing protein [Mitsuaria sp. GD03876]MDH0863272.1 Wzz/FepE/Etk N-terminal domain-containing protein [Mitsuaria sp. GD03876]
MSEQSLSTGADAVTPPYPVDALDVAVTLAEHAKPIALITAVATAGAVAAALLLTPVYTAKVTLLPPQQQNAASSALSQLGSLAGLAGGAAGIKNPIDQYVSLFQSNTVSDAIIKQFNLVEVYEAKFQEDARKQLHKLVEVAAGKRDGIISIEVQDTDPKRAAAIANAHVDQLRSLTGSLAVSEAQQRRKFFEDLLTQTKDKLTQAQLALQSSGFNEGALNAEPKSAADAFARMRAELTAATVRLGTLRRNMADSSAEVQTAREQVAQLQTQVQRLESAAKDGNGADYVGRYREFKYQETLFDLFAKQYEAARVDESREGALIQVIDPASPPERRSSPKRALLVLGAAAGSFAASLVFFMLRRLLRAAGRDAHQARKIERIRRALGRQPR